MKKIQTGVDGSGTAILRYPYFDVTLHLSKISNLMLDSEIHAGKKTLILDSVSITESIELHDGETGKKIQLAVSPSAHLMLDEAKEFARILKDPENTKNKQDYEEWKQLSRDVSIWLEKLRKQAGLFFEADQEEN